MHHLVLIITAKLIKWRLLTLLKPYTILHLASLPFLLPSLPTLYLLLIQTTPSTTSSKLSTNRPKWMEGCFIWARSISMSSSLKSILWPRLYGLTSLTTISECFNRPSVSSLSSSSSGSIIILCEQFLWSYVSVRSYKNSISKILRWSDFQES